DTDGYEPDGLVTVDELAKYLEKEVADEARKIGKTNKEKEAVPYIVGEEFSHFPLTKDPAVTPTVTKRVEALAALQKDSKVDKEAAEEGRALLTRMPKLKAQQDLRKKYEDLADGKLSAADFKSARDAIKAGMKLPADAAETFARKVYVGIEMVKAK